MARYVFQAVVGGPIKLGYSKTRAGVQGRLASCQTGSPWPLRVVEVFPDETDWPCGDLRTRFPMAHVHGEWFVPTPELCDEIGLDTEKVQVPPGLEDPEVEFGQTLLWKHGARELCHDFFDEGYDEGHEDGFCRGAEPMESLSRGIANHINIREAR